MKKLIVSILVVCLSFVGGVRCTGGGDDNAFLLLALLALGLGGPNVSPETAGEDAGAEAAPEAVETTPAEELAADPAPVFTPEDAEALDAAEATSNDGAKDSAASSENSDSSDSSDSADNNGASDDGDDSVAENSEDNTYITPVADGSSSTTQENSSSGDSGSSGSSEPEEVVIATGEETGADTTASPPAGAASNANDNGSSASNGNGNSGSGTESGSDTADNSGSDTGDDFDDSDVTFEDAGIGVNPDAGADAAGASGSCGSRSLSLDTTGGKWYTPEAKNKGQAKKSTGIYTYWQSQKLTLRVRNNCDAGWYQLRVKASNIQGPLPDFYDSFNITVQNEITGRQLGGIFVKASDNAPHQGLLWVYLGAGDTNLDLIWTNDAYEEGVYDANLLIEGVALSSKAKQRYRKSVVRNALNYCEVGGRFFYDTQARTARTYWKDQNIAYCFYDLEPGLYQVEVRARNYGELGLPDGYTAFEVDVAADGVSGTAVIPADEKNFRTGSAVLDIRGGDATVMLTWRNDRYQADVFDANIEYKDVFLKRIGNSQRTGLAAYISEAGQGGGAVILIAILVAILGLGGIYAYRRSRESAVA